MHGSYQVDGARGQGRLRHAGKSRGETMNKHKAKLKLQEVQSHRAAQLDKALDKLIRGEVSPEYVKLRADKLKQVK